MVGLAPPLRGSCLRSRLRGVSHRPQKIKALHPEKQDEMLKNNIPRFHPHCRKIKLFCHSNNFNAVNTIGLISKTVFTNARKWSWDTEMISHTNRNLSENSLLSVVLSQRFTILYIFYTDFNPMSTPKLICRGLKLCVVAGFHACNLHFKL